MTPALSRMMMALRDELADWAATSERLEGVIGDALEGRRLAPTEIEAVQALDGLSQHLRQLAQLCGDLGDEGALGIADTDERLTSAVRRLNLGGLGQRLGAVADRSAPLATGEAELW